MTVSIITVTYNRARLIGETIQSVLGQTYTDFEYLIVDDGSTDDTQAVVKSFDDSRIQYYKHGHCGNLSQLQNFGIRKAKGSVIAILDSDDIWTSNKLDVAVEVFKNSDAQFITHNIRYFSDIRNLMPPYYNTAADFHESIIEKVLQFRILPFPVALFRKDILPEPMLNESFADGQQDFLFRVAAKHHVYFISECLTYMRLHGDNIHKSNVRSYFSNYYKSIWALFSQRKISFTMFIKGMVLNSRNFGKHLILAHKLCKTI